jgi:hypothetical protein
MRVLVTRDQGAAKQITRLFRPFDLIEKVKALLNESLSSREAVIS